MADIKNYLREKEKRERNQSQYKDKIVRHRLTNAYRAVLVIAALAAVAALVVVQYKRHIYTGYDIISTITRESIADATDVRLQDHILTYSKDGAHSTNSRGEVTWNQTYQMQDVIVSMCKDVAAIANYNGREIYVQSAEEQLRTITTTMPIRNITVSATGSVTAVLADTDVTWINTYSTEGSDYTGQAHMNDSGYPAAISLSPNGELLAVSYIYIDAGVLKTNIAFYNYGAVGENHNDFIVSAYPYTDVLVPEIEFMNDSTVYAVGNDRLMIYKGSQKPVLEAAHLYEQEIQSVYHSDQYVGLVFLSENAEYQYRFDVFDTSAQKVGSYYFNQDYTDIFFEQDDFVVYNETRCTIINFDGVEKYNGNFSKSVQLMIPTNSAYRYQLITDTSIDTIQLK